MKGKGRKEFRAHKLISLIPLTHHMKCYKMAWKYNMECYRLPPSQESRPRDLGLILKEIGKLLTKIILMLPSSFSLSVVTPLHLAVVGLRSPGSLDITSKDLHRVLKILKCVLDIQGIWADLLL